MGSRDNTNLVTVYVHVRRCHLQPSGHIRHSAYSVKLKIQPLHGNGLWNQSPGPSTPPPKKQKRAYAKRRTIDEKLLDIFTVIDKAGWSFADFLFYAFRHKDDEAEDIHREQAHANTVQKFLAGYTEHTPAEILPT